MLGVIFNLIGNFLYRQFKCTNVCLVVEAQAIGDLRPGIRDHEAQVLFVRDEDITMRQEVIFSLMKAW